MNAALAVEITDPDAGDDELERLTIQLREELLGLDVDDVSRRSAGPPPDGSRALDVAVVGALLVTAKQSAELVSTVVSTVRDWLRRGSDPARTVTVTIDGQSLSLSAATSEEQDLLVREFIQRIGRGATGEAGER